jgi:hypothetical protein
MIVALAVRIWTSKLREPEGWPVRDAPPGKPVDICESILVKGMREGLEDSPMLPLSTSDSRRL